MGQYYLVVNLDKKEYLYPHRLGDGLKLLEFGCSADGTMTALAVLLAEGNGRGGGDLGSDDPLVGSWARDRIVVAGDYADPEEDGRTLYTIAHEEYRDISPDIRRVLAEGDSYVAENLRKSWASEDREEE